VNVQYRWGEKEKGIEKVKEKNTSYSEIS